MIPDKAPLSLFFDVDGTLIDIAERPEGVRVPASLKRALEAASVACHGALALVSGRTIANLDDLFAPLRLPASGVHGAEMRFASNLGTEIASHDVLDPESAAAVERLAASVPGTIVENKRFSVALHYRQVPDRRAFIDAALHQMVSQSGDRSLRILPGHMVFELKRATFDKGMAIRRFMSHAPFAGRVPVFVGDDVTDRPGFDTVLELGGYAYSVGPLFEGLSGSFPDPAAVRYWLAGLAESETSHA